MNTRTGRQEAMLIKKLYIRQITYQILSYMCTVKKRKPVSIMVYMQNGLYQICIAVHISVHECILIFEYVLFWHKFCYNPTKFYSIFPFHFILFLTLINCMLSFEAVLFHTPPQSSKDRIGEKNIFIQIRESKCCGVWNSRISRNLVYRGSDLL